MLERLSWLAEHNPIREQRELYSHVQGRAHFPIRHRTVGLNLIWLRLVRRLQSG